LLSNLYARLGNSSLKTHFAIALLLGCAARALCAYYVYGPQALDDFNHGILPAYHWLTEGAIDAPQYRSHVLIWIIGALMRTSISLGLETPVAQLRAVYFGLGLISLTGIWGTYLFVRNSTRPLFAMTALYLVALFPLMPFMSTRAFGESVAAGIVLLGVGFLEDLKARQKESGWLWVLGFYILGTAALFRFQVGVLYVAYGAMFLWGTFRKAFLFAIYAGVLLLLTEGLIDLCSGKSAFTTLAAYLSENKNGAVEYGVTPWYATWILFLGLLLFPLSLLLRTSFVSLITTHWRWILPILIFVGVHSAIPHKEERFLYPIVGLEMWMLAWLWSQSADRRLVKRFFTPFLFLLCTIGTLIVCTTNSQSGTIDPLAWTSSQSSRALVVYYRIKEAHSYFHDFFIRRPTIAEFYEENELSSHSLDQLYREHRTHDTIAVITSDAEAEKELKQLSGQETLLGHCSALKTASSIFDRLLFAANPRHNQRRSPSYVLICQRKLESVDDPNTLLGRLERSPAHRGF
jgi:hypothetical protein